MGFKVTRTTITQTESFINLDDDDIEQILIEHFKKKFPQEEITVRFGCGQVYSAVVVCKSVETELSHSNGDGHYESI